MARHLAEMHDDREEENWQAGQAAQSEELAEQQGFLEAEKKEAEKVEQDLRAAAEAQAQEEAEHRHFLQAVEVKKKLQEEIMTAARSLLRQSIDAAARKLDARGSLGEAAASSTAIRIDSSPELMVKVKLEQEVEKRKRRRRRRTTVGVAAHLDLGTSAAVAAHLDLGTSAEGGGGGSLVTEWRARCETSPLSGLTQSFNMKKAKTNCPYLLSLPMVVALPACSNMNKKVSRSRR